MPEKLFGTDGVRGVANTELTPALALALGASAARTLGRGHTPRFIIGRDTRVSGTLLESALAAGLCSMGALVVTAGVVPTPAVAGIARMQGFDAGVVISASHNPFADNGIKFFGGDGYKLDDALEAEIEAQLALVETWERPSGAAVGRLGARHEPGRPVCRPSGRHPGRRFAGRSERWSSTRRTVPIPPSARACSPTWGPRSSPCTATPTASTSTPGCGSLHPDEMMRRTVAERADMGLAFDGDADRVILSDELGRKVDGDRVMLLVGRHLAASGKLANDTVVGTIMSNMGLEVALRESGLTLLRTAVGDRYVSEAMRRDGHVLGGEKSGHLIFGHLTTTGDGLLTALQVLKVMRETGLPLSALADQMTEYPQVLLGVRVRDRQSWASDPDITRAIEATEARLAGRGRVNVRASGTEKLVRVMAEGPDQAEIDALAHEIASLVQKKVGE